MFTPEFLAGCSIALLGVAATIVIGAWLLRSARTFPLQRRMAVFGAVAVCELAFWLCVYAYFVAPNRPVVHEVSIVSEQWHGRPLRIAVFGNVGLTGPHMNAARVEGLVAQIDDKLRPDLVVLLGNYVAGAPASQRSDRDREQIARSFTAYALLNAPMGVVAVLGDQDFRYGPDTTVRALEDAGVAVLANRNVSITRRGVSVVMAGADAERPDIAAALDGAPSGDVIALSNTQRAFVQAPARAALMLTTCADGPCGTRSVGGHLLYATTGLGMRRFRLFNAPEVALITLSGAGAAP